MSETFDTIMKFVETLTQYDKDQLLKMFNYYEKHKDDPEFLEVWNIMLQWSDESD